MTPVESDILLIRLANELEDHLDLGVLYQGDADRRRRYMRPHRASCVDMAERLGATGLAAALTATFDEVATTEVPVSLQRAEESSFLVTPASHRVRLRIVVSHLLDRLRRPSSRS
jgi:hypothetical protein